MVRHLFLVFLFVTGCSAQAVQIDSLLIQNVNVVTPDRPEVQYDVDVLIEDGNIVAVDSNLAHNDDVKVIDGRGLYLTPGLIDSHVHLYHATGLKRQYTDDYDALYRAYMEQAPLSYLYFGYTTLIELNADFETLDNFKQHPLKPRVFHCGQGVVMPDGFMALEYEDGGITRAFPDFLYDAYRGGLFPDGFNRRDHTPAAVVKSVVDKGGICVKLFYEEALWWPGGAPEFALPTKEIVSDVVNAAHDLGLPVILHATTAAGHAFGVDVGVDILTHGPWEWSGVSYDHMVPPPEVKAVADKIAMGATKLQPTMQTLRNTASMFDSASLDHPALAHVLPAAYINYLKTDAQVQRDKFLAIFGPSFNDMLGAERNSEVQLTELGRLQLAFNMRYERLIGTMQQKGTKLLFGTDTAVGGFGWGNPPGLNGYMEMLGWQRAGISLRAIFEAATLGNAKAFGLNHTIGTITPGKRADLLLMRGNPLEDLSAYDAIETVIIAGRPIARADLSAGK